MGVRPGYKQTELGSIPVDWETKELRELSPGQSVGLVVNPSTYVIESGTVPMLVGSNIDANKISWKDARRISTESSQMLPASRLNAGDLVTVRVGEPGITAVVPQELDGCNCASIMIVRRHDEFSSEWLSYAMNSRAGLAQIENVQYGTAQKQFNISDAIKFIYATPPLPEQRAIAAALSDTDELIAGLEALVAKKRAIKQGAMQQLLTGRKRLPGFTGEWEEKRLGDVLRVRHGRSQHAVSHPEGQFPIFASGGEIGRATEFLYDSPSVLIGRKGTIDEPRYADTPFWTVDTLFYTEISVVYDVKFVFFIFCTVNWLNYNEASGVPSLNARVIENIEVSIPSLSEQQAIAAVLSDMDAEIESLEGQLGKTRALKQGMMQELLTGRIRLV